MRILVLNWQCRKNPFAGGAEVYATRVFGALAARGHDVTLLVSRFDGAPRVETLDGIRVVRYGHRNTFNFEYAAALRWLGRFDVVVEDFNKLPFYARFATRAPVVVAVMHLFGRVIFSEINALLAAYVFAQERLALRLYRDLPFVAICEGTRDELASLGVRDVRVIRVGVESDLYGPAEKASVPTVIYAGRLKRYKRADLALRAVALAMRRVPDGRLVIVGDGEALPSLKRLVERLGIAKRVRFTGYVSRQEKLRLMGEAWVGVNTSPKEGWGLVNTECQARGTPVVAFDAQGIRESLVAGRTGFLLPYGDVEGLAREIERLLTDGELARRMGAEGREWTRALSWERSAEEWEAFLEAVVARGRVRR